MAAVIVHNGPADEPVEEVKAEEVPAEEVKTEEAEEPPKKKHSIDERLEKMAAQKREAQAAAEQLKKERDELKAALEGLNKQVNKNSEPKPEDFTDAVKYAEALADWKLDQRLKERAAKDAADKAAAEAQRIASEWQKKVKKAAKEIEDFHEVVDQSDIPVSYNLRDAILESDIGPQIQYYLVQNPDLVDELNQMPVAKMQRAFGRLEAKLEREAEKEEKIEPRKKVAEPPEPISPVKGIGSTGLGAVNQAGQYTGSFKQFKADYKAGRIR